MEEGSELRWVERTGIRTVCMETVENPRRCYWSIMSFELVKIVRDLVNQNSDGRMGRISRCAVHRD